MENKTIPYGRQHIEIEDIEAVVETLQSEYLTTGPKVKEFEVNFAKYIGSKYAVAVSNGTAALHLSAMALGVNSKSKVITSPITFVATANCIAYCGGEIDFVDIDPNSYLIDEVKLRNLLESVPKGTYQGVIPVDFAGRPVNMEKIYEIAKEFGLWIIEDACHAPGGYFIDSHGNQQKCGNCTYADLAIFSFHPVKHITCGEGGMITTNCEEMYLKLLSLRSHGMVYQGNSKLIENHGGWYMEMQNLGYNYRMPDILCALGISQLKRADKGLIRRREIAKKYNEAFAKSDLIIGHSGIVDGHAYHLYILEVKNRKYLYDELRKSSIYTQIHYIPCHKMPFYKGKTLSGSSLTFSENYYEHCISLPMYPNLTKEEQEFVISRIFEILTSNE